MDQCQRDYVQSYEAKPHFLEDSSKGHFEDHQNQDTVLWSPDTNKELIQSQLIQRCANGSPKSHWEYKSLGQEQI